MFIRLLLGLLILVGVMAFLGWYGKASDEQRNQAIKSLLIYGVALALLVLVFTGRIPWLFAIVSAALPFWKKFMAARGVLGMFHRYTGHSFTQTRLTTQWLRIDFDIVARKMDAEILQGDHLGKRLSELEQTEIEQLLNDCATDKQSVAAIYAYLRTRDFGWQGHAHSGQDEKQQDSTDFNALSMTRAQALEVLGLDESASETDIRKTHKRLIQKLHPDRGGSDYLAAQINAAKSVLLD